MLTSRSVLLNTPLRSPAVTLHKLLSPHWQQTPASLTHRPTSPTRSRTALTRSAFSTSTSSTSSTSLSPQSFASTKSIRVSKTIYLRPQPRAFTRSIASTPRHARATDSFSSPTSYLRSPHTPTQSAAGTWLSIVLLGLISGGAYLYRSATRSSKTEEEEEEEDELNDPLEAHIKAFVAHHMTGEIMPGRPGTLTPEEDEKLRILWIAVLHVFGVINKEETHALNQNVHGTLPALTRKTTTDSAKEKKEVKRGWFGRHKEESEDLQEDKYGQTAQFKHALANMKPETLRRAFWDMVKHDHPDGLLLRFLRARKWDVEKALVMMVSTMHWRAEEMHVDDDVMLRGEEAMVNQTKSSDAKEARFGEDFLAMMRTGKTYVHGEDKEGRPMCFVRVRLHHAGDQSEASSERYTVYIIETARALLNPPQDTSCIVFDMTNFTLANMDYAPVKFMIKVFEANYPESLGIVLIHKAPWIFNAIWRIIRGLLDPVVAAKVHFTNNIDDLGQFVDVDRLPKDIEGNEDWEYKYVEPIPGENDIMKDTAARDKILAERTEISNEYEKRTIEWIKQKGAEEAMNARHECRNKLKDNYWKLDPYIRERSFYDRVGVMQPGGGVNWGAVSPAIAAANAKLKAAEAEKPVEAQLPVANGHVVTNGNDVD